ncbi:MAG: HEAT repeat domain-containing protein [Spirochaetaceae bacterium]|jgi:HEAT repeat protein|nr:HEAT repeat domain-containing protein [Spirochaetaceae bacterium]
MLMDLFNQYRLYFFIAGGVIVFFLLVLIVIGLFRRAKLSREIQHAKGIGNTKWIIKYNSMVIHLLKKDPQLFQQNIEIGDAWLDRLMEKNQLKWLHLLMNYGADQFHFDCFLAALERPKLMDAYYPYLQGEDDMYLIERLAKSCHGRDFDGSKAKPFLKGSLYSLRDLTGSPHWENRFFAYNLLIHSQDEKAQRSLWEGLSDVHPKVRILLVKKMQTQERERFYLVLRDVLLDDPFYPARNTAKNRIYGEFKDLYKVDPQELEHHQLHHILSLLNQESDKDKDLALRTLQEEDDSLAQMAMLFLNRTGILRGLFENVKCSDQEDMSRNQNILQRALDLGSDDFFEAKSAWDTEGSLLLASRILIDRGNPYWLDLLAKKAFEKNPRSSDYSWEIYENTLKAIDRRGNETSQQYKCKEIEKYKADSELLTLLLQSIPETQNYSFKQQLLNNYIDEKFPRRDLLIERLQEFEPSLLMDELYHFITEPNIPLLIKQDSLKILVHLNQSYTLQTILENLPLLNFEDLLEIEEKIALFPQKEFKKKVDYLLKGTDATVRASLIVVLPEKVAKEHSDKIEESLKDSFADVRVAATYKMSQLGLLKSSKTHLLLLKDPVPRVRISSAKIFADLGEEKAIEQLQLVLENEDEVRPVKESIITALILGKNTQGLDPLMDFLEHQKDYEEFLIEELAQRTDREYVLQLVEHFRDASPVLKDKLVKSFVLMGEKIEELLTTLLTEEVTSLQEFLVSIMEKSGYVESLHKRLSDRDPRVRRRTAKLLSLVGTRGSFKAIVLASKDPDDEVRVSVTRALEKLNSKEGSQLLKELEEDPDPRVRRFTRWAMERIKVKGRL